MSRIPLATGTLKERKERQAKAEADLELEIKNSQLLARASRDYWVNFLLYTWLSNRFVCFLPNPSSA